MNKISGRHADPKYLFTLVKNASKDVASIRVRRPIRGYIYIVDRIAANVSKKKNGSLDNIQQGRRNKRRVLLLVSKPAFLNASNSRCFARELSEGGGLPQRQSLAQA